MRHFVAVLGNYQQNMVSLRKSFLSWIIDSFNAGGSPTVAVGVFRGRPLCRRRGDTVGIIVSPNNPCTGAIGAGVLGFFLLMVFHLVV
jgi:hypothetical protein